VKRRPRRTLQLRYVSRFQALDIYA